MSVLPPPPLPVGALPSNAAAPWPRVHVPTDDQSTFRVGLVLTFLPCCTLPIVAATLYIWHRDMTAGGAGPLVGGFFYLVGFLFVYLLGFLTAIFNCWH